MDKPADPATPFDEVYQSFLDDLALEGIKPSTIHRYRYNIVRFEKWLVANGRAATLRLSSGRSSLPTSSTSRPLKPAGGGRDRSSSRELELTRILLQGGSGPAPTHRPRQSQILRRRSSRVLLSRSNPGRPLPLNS